MASTNDIVQKRKQGGAATERREFTVDRGRAIKKMRRFALEDPRYYLLELIQAAIANGAGFISIDLFRLRTEQDDLKMRWNGLGFSGLELSRLFDFLFISDDEPGCADTILLARGVNAMLHFKPKRITISCGDGTIDGSRRFVIYPNKSQPTEVDIVETIDGIKLHADALRSSLLPPGPDQGLGAREVLMLEQKCIAPKVRVMLNGRFVSDWNAAYSDQIETQREFVEIEEPDLYGRLWKTVGGRNGSFDLMTWGVKIESLARSQPPFEGLSGAINYNRLNKTADHARIVRDEVLDELWARLEPHASQLHRGGGGEATYNIRNLQRERFGPMELLEVIRGAERVIAVPEDVLGNAAAYRAAEAIRDAFDAPILAVDEHAWQTLRMLVGSDGEIVAPSLLEPFDVEVFTCQPASPPPRPWLTEPLSVEAVPIGEFARSLCRASRVDDSDRKRIVEALGADGEVDLRVYSPQDEGDIDMGQGSCWVQVLVCERLIWEGEVDSVYPGLRLYVELPAVSPSGLVQKVRVEAGTRGAREVELMILVAEMAVSLARDELRRASERALRTLSRGEVQPGSLASRIALNSLGRGGLLRVRSDGDSGGSKVVVSIFDQESAGLLDVAICRTVDGQSVTARTLGQMLHDHSGLIYGTLDTKESGLDSLDLSRVLALDAEQERFVISLIGADAYARIDRREVLAEYRGVQVRDVAVGLRDYPEFPLWVEGADPTEMPAEAREDTLRELVGQLVDGLKNDGRQWHHQEARRQARRHLLHYLSACETPEPGIVELSLVDTADGGRCSFRELVDAIESGERVVMADGRAVDVVAPLAPGQSVEQAAAESREHSDLRCLELRFNPFLLYLIQEKGPVEGAFDFDLSSAEAIQNDNTPDTAFIAAERIDEQGIGGIVGLAVEPVAQHVIAVIERDSRDVHLLREPARQLGLVGRVVVDAQTLQRPERLNELIINAGEEVVERLVKVAARLEEPHARRRVIDAILSFAAKHLAFTTTDSGRTIHTVNHALAERILELPLFRTDAGTPVSGRSLAGQFCRATDSGEALSSPLSEQAPPSLHRWVEANLQPSAIYRSAPARISTVAGSSEPNDLDGDILEILARRLDELWPDGAMQEFGGWLELDWQESEAASDEGRIAKCVQRPAGVVKLYLNDSHPLVKKAQQAEEPDSDSFAWLLLAVFAELNARLESVTNEHELAFQRRVADVLEGAR